MMVAMKRLYTVKNSFWADAVDNSDRGRIFYRDETLWWDTEQTIDPVVFEVDGRLFFQIPRSVFLRCIQVVTPSQKFLATSTLPGPDQKSTSELPARNSGIPRDGSTLA